MMDSNGGGNHLQEEMGDEMSLSDEFIIDISILFAEFEPGEREKYKAENHKVEISEEQTSTEEIYTKPNIKCRTPDWHLQAKFFWALIDDKFEEFVRLLKHKKVKLNYDYSKPNYPENGTCLEIATRLHGRSKYVKVLLDCGVAPNVNEVLTEPIHYAAKYGNPEALKILLQDKRTNINAVDKDGRTALHMAVSNFKKERDEKYRECIILLLSSPTFDINKPNKKGYTAIHEAANNCKELVELILKQRSHDLDLDTHRGNGRTAREFISHKYEELKSILPDTKQEKLLSSFDIQLLRALLGQKLRKFTTILQQIDNDGNARVDPNIFYGNPHNATCLQIACMKDECVEFVKLLLKAGADPNTINPITKQTPLFSALERGNHNVSSVLLKDKRTNVNAVNSDGKSVLHIIAEWIETADTRKHAIDILNLVLKETKVKVNLTDKCDQTAAGIALANNNKDFLETLLTYAGSQMDLDAVLQPNNETLRQAIRIKYPDLEVKFPSSRHTVTDDVITTLFDHLYSKKIDEFLNVLHQRDEKLDINTDDGNYTLLQYAVLYELEEPVRELLKENANPNKTTQYEKRPPIIIASQRKNQGILRILLETKSTNVNVTDIAGNTALHYASKNRDLDSVVALLRRGAKILHTNLFGKSHLPADSIKFFLNGSLKTNDVFPDHENYEMIFDYNFLLAYREEHNKESPTEDQRQPLIRDAEANKNVLQSERFPPEMDFLHNISEYKEIMEHPIITSFLHIKWLRVRMAYLINLFIYLLFVLSTNVYIAVKIGEDDITNTLFDKFSLYFLLVFVSYSGLIEIIQFCSSPKVYFKNWVNFLDIMLIVVIIALALENSKQSILVVLLILVSWTELMLMTSRVHRLSSNIEMLKAVIINYFWLLTSYACLLVAFGLSFYSVYHAAAKEEQRQRKGNSTETDEKLQFYASAPLSLIKAVVMMMGEFEANNLLTHMTNNWIGFVLFILFVFLVPMVLLNLLTGVAVSDIQSIKSNDHILCLVSRIELIYDLEKNLLFLHRLAERLKSRTPKVVRPFLIALEATLKNISLFSDTTPKNQNIRIRPNQSENIIIDHNNHKTESRLELKILRETLEIISDRHEKIFGESRS